MAGFGGRILNPEDMPKFINSPQTVLFDKGRLLYGLDRARKTIRAQEQAVIVEGYLDVIALHQSGYTDAVSPMGTALTEHQLTLLKRYTQRIVLALDPDAAGDKATLRGLQIARQTMDRETEPIFDARGLLTYEARLQADLRVSTLPEELDPDEIVNHDPQQWAQIVAAARPIVIHVMETLAAGKDLEDPKVKDEIASQVLPLISDVPSPIERDTYLQRLARLLHVDERALFDWSGKPGRSRRVTGRRSARRQPTEPSTGLLGAAVESVNRLEMHCLGVLLRRPDLLYQVDRKLQEHKLDRLAPGDFQQAGHQAIFRLLQESVDQDMAEPLNYVLSSLSLEMMELADELLARTDQLDPNEERVLEDLMRALLDLRSRNLRQEIEYLRYLMEDAQEKGDLKVPHYQQTMVQHTLTLQRLNRALGEYTSRGMIVH
jgi:DNA primase